MQNEPKYFNIQNTEGYFLTIDPEINSKNDYLYS